MSGHVTLLMSNWISKTISNENLKALLILEWKGILSKNRSLYDMMSTIKPVKYVFLVQIKFLVIQEIIMWKRGYY